MSSAASTSATPTAGATKRLLRELANWRAEQRQHWQEMMTKREQRQQGGSDQVGGAGDENLRDVGGIERLGPVAEDQLLRWEAVINGRGLGGGYDGTLFGYAVSFKSPIYFNLALTVEVEHVEDGILIY